VKLFKKECRHCFLKSVSTVKNIPIPAVDTGPGYAPTVKRISPGIRQNPRGKKRKKTKEINNIVNGIFFFGPYYDKIFPAGIII